MIAIRLLGPIELEVNGRTVTLQSRKAAALLAYLVLTGKSASRPFLAELFWPGQTEQRGRANLSWILNHLRKNIPDCLTADSHTIEFKTDEGTMIDVNRFTALIHEGTVPALENAVSLARGELLAGLTLENCPEFELWLTGERERWRQRVSDATLNLIQGCREVGKFTAAIEHARQLLALAPWREAAHQELIRLLALTGHRSEALAQYERCRQILKDELNLTPSSETEDLVVRIKAGELTASLPPPQTLRFLPPKPATPFYGRTSELAQIESQLLSPNYRLLTIVGIGGMGKTRLALEVSHRLADLFTDGAVFVTLAGLEIPDQLAVVIADKVNFQFKPSDKESLEFQLIQFLAGKTLLLILDNFENLLEGTPFILEILNKCPNLKIIITSRVRLNLQAEALLLLGPLESEPNDKEDSAVSLFMERAKRIRPDFNPTTAEMTAIQQLVSNVGRHPLAIELAAAQLYVTSLQSIVKETAENIQALQVTFADFPDRHHSIEAIFDRSWRSLTLPERTTLGKLAFCQGGCTINAAGKLTGAERPIFATLTNQSLIQMLNGRVQMHELLRQFVRQHLAPDQSQEALSNHARYYLTWLVNQGENIRGPNQIEALKAVRAESENIRQAWRWLFKKPENLTQLPFSLLELCIVLQRFLQRDGRFSERDVFFGSAAGLVSEWPDGERYSAVFRAFEIIMTPVDWLSELQDINVDNLVQQTYQESPPEELALFHFALGYLNQSELGPNIEQDTSCQHLHSSLQIYQELGQPEKETTVRFTLARQLSQLSDNTAAIEHLEWCRDHYHRFGDIWGEARTLQRLGRFRYKVGHFDLAAATFFRCQILYQSLGYLPGLAVSTRWMGNIAYADGQFEQAHAHYLQALELEEELGDLYQIGRCYNNLGVVCKDIGEFEQAEFWYRQSIKTFENVETLGLAAMAYNNFGMLFEAQGSYDEALLLVKKGLEMRLASGGPPSAIDDMINLGQILTALKEYDLAQYHLKQALQLSLQGGRENLSLEALCILARIHVENRRPKKAISLIQLLLTHPAASHLNRIQSQEIVSEFDLQIGENFPKPSLQELARAELNQSID